jgi:hypothetical protein
MSKEEEKEKKRKKGSTVPLQAFLRISKLGDLRWERKDKTIQISESRKMAIPFPTQVQVKMTKGKMDNCFV